MSAEQSLRNADIAFDSGADGVFLINHEISPTQLERIYREVRKEYPDEMVGLNFLGCTSIEAVNRLPLDAGALWLDDVGYTDDEGTKKVEELLSDLRIVLAHEGLLFGGVDFKYREPVEDLPLAVIRLAPLVDVITTSGGAAGIPPVLEKMRLIKRSIRHSDKPDARIGVVNGMTSKNVEPFLELVNDFLVATGVSDTRTEFNRNKMREMVHALGH